MLNALKKISAATLLLLASQALLLLAMRMISERLGPRGYGEFGLGISISMYCWQFIQWGMDQLLTVRFARADEVETRRLLGILLRQKQLAALAVLAVAVAGVALAAKTSERPLFFLGAVDGVMLAFTIPSIFDSRLRTAQWQFFAFLRHAAYVATLLVIAYFFPQQFSPVAVLALHALCIVPEVFLEQIWIQKNIGMPTWPASVSDAMSLWREAAPMALGILAQQILFYSGTFALYYFGRGSEMGALTACNQLTMGAASLLAAPSAMIQVRIAQRAESRRAFASIVLRMSVLCAFAGTAISLAFPYAAALLSRVIFKSFADSMDGILAIDAWRLAAILLSAPLTAALLSRNRLRAFAICWTLALASAAAIAARFIPSYGAKAASGAVASGAFVFCIAAVILILLEPRASRVGPNA